MFVPFLSLGQYPQLVVPVGFQRVSHQAIVRIYLHIPILSEIGFIASAFDLLVA